MGWLLHWKGASSIEKSTMKKIKKMLPAVLDVAPKNKGGESASSGVKKRVPGCWYRQTTDTTYSMLLYN